MKVTNLGDFDDNLDRIITSGPKYSYERVLSMFFMSKSGNIHTVEDATAEEFSAFIQCLLPAPREPKNCKDALEGLDYSEMIDRWFAIDTLHSHGANVHIYHTEDQARKAGLAVLIPTARSQRDIKALETAKAASRRSAKRQKEKKAS